MTEQGFIGLLRGNQKSMFWYYGVSRIISNPALGVGQSFLCQREGVGHVFFIKHVSKYSGPPTPLPYTFLPVPYRNNFKQREQLPLNL